MDGPLLLTAVLALLLSNAEPKCDNPVRLWIQGSVLRMALEIACSWSAALLPPDAPYDRSTPMGFLASIRAPVYLVARLWCVGLCVCDRAVWRLVPLDL